MRKRLKAFKLSISPNCKVKSGWKATRANPNQLSLNCRHLKVSCKSQNTHLKCTKRLGHTLGFAHKSDWNLKLIRKNLACQSDDMFALFWSCTNFRYTKNLQPQSVLLQRNDVNLNTTEWQNIRIIYLTEQCLNALALRLAPIRHDNARLAVALPAIWWHPMLHYVSDLSRRNWIPSVSTPLTLDKDF